MARADTLLPHRLNPESCPPMWLDDSALIPAGAFGGERDVAWRRLAHQASEPNVFAEAWTVRAAVRSLDACDAVTIAWVTDERGQALGTLPLARGATYGRLAIAHTTNWSHANSFAGTPIVRAGAEAAFWRRLLTLLDESDWPGFLHLTGLNADGPVLAGLAQVAAERGLPLASVHRTTRALLSSDLSPGDYWTANVRKKKRKELARLSNRLADEGAVACTRLGEREPVDEWVESFLALESAGWKGRADSAMACAPGTDKVFRATIAGAHDRRRLHALTLSVGGRPIAMLATLLARPGAFSYKIAYDEAFARFSPGVLIERHALALLDEPGIEWVDSCAAADHPMIDSLWAERRAVVRVTLPLAGRRRRAVHELTRLAERGWTAARRLTGAPA